MTTTQKQSGYLECGGGQTPLWLCVVERSTYRGFIARTAKAAIPRRTPKRSARTFDVIWPREALWTAPRQRRFSREFLCDYLSQMR